MMTSSCVVFLLVLIGGVVGLLDSGIESPLEAQVLALTQKVEQLEQTVASLKNQTTSHGPVAFYAGLKATITNLGAHQHIIFDHVYTNVGNAYNPAHGYFTAPTRGAYAFFVTITNIIYHPTHITLRKNGQFLAHALVHGAAGQPYFLSSTIAVTAHLEIGDEVWVQSENVNTDVEEIDGGDWSLFSGHLIGAD